MWSISMPMPGSVGQAIAIGASSGLLTVVLASATAEALDEL
ncbi:hypothetical protein ABI_00140 [Asticcacaulis biprosthecium C19]|uniref:Uncharacterized protein n=1 Tax=Asticcacaulis biprosthecium C19 TaxID=715226 RepID=F4QFX1_9CAUL|nr:hypothetical protein ABI_00140 [Asticcacaulis biprosthecium C19]